MAPSVVWLVWRLLAEAQSSDPWLVVPGKSVGAITATTTRAELVGYFGASNVSDRMAGPGGDAEAVPATVVNGQQAESRLVIFWDKLDATGNHPEATAHPDFLRLCYGNEAPGMHCKWHLANGLSLGTSRRELEALNGRSFDLSGFGWDYSGTVTDWKGGKLAGQLRACGLVGVALAPKPASPGSPEERLPMAVSGDKTFSSSDPAMQQVNPVIYPITVKFPASGNCPAI